MGEKKIGCVAALLCAIVMPVDVAAGQEDNSSTNTPISQGTDGSVLYGFESSVQPTPEERNHTRPSYKRKHDDGIISGLVEEVGGGIADLFGEALLNVTMAFLAEGGRSSMQRLDPEAADASFRRNEGEPLIPFARYDFGYQQVSPNITGRINRFEGGYGPLALIMENYALSERSPVSALNIKRHMFLYRMSNNQAEIDIGFGRSVITGVQRTVINAIPVRFRVRVGESFSIDIMVFGGERMDDAEVAFHVGRQFGSFKVGHRTLHSPGASLSGPFAGVAFYF